MATVMKVCACNMVELSIDELLRSTLCRIRLKLANVVIEKENAVNLVIKRQENVLNRDSSWALRYEIHTSRNPYANI